MGGKEPEHRCRFVSGRKNIHLKCTPGAPLGKIIAGSFLQDSLEPHHLYSTILPIRENQNHFSTNMMTVRQISQVSMNKGNLNS